MKPTPLMVIGAIFLGSLLLRGVEVATAATTSDSKKADHKEEMVDDTNGKKHADASETHTKPDAHAGKDAHLNAVSKAHADSDEHHDGKHETYAKQPVAATPAAYAKTPELSAFSREDSRALLAEIRERSIALDAREAEIADRTKVLEVLEARIEQKTTMLEKAKYELDERLTYAEESARKDISQLARMYENMKPAKAGEIFNSMEPSFAAGFLTEMTSEAAAQILTNMETEKAYAASVIIAGRNARVNKP